MCFWTTRVCDRKEQLGTKPGQEQFEGCSFGLKLSRPQLAGVTYCFCFLWCRTSNFPWKTVCKCRGQFRKRFQNTIENHFCTQISYYCFLLQKIVEISKIPLLNIFSNVMDSQGQCRRQEVFEGPKLTKNMRKRCPPMSRCGLKKISSKNIEF